MTRRLFMLVACSLWLDAAPSAAQPARFVDAVRDLARSASVDVRQRAPIAPLVDRMAAALAEWDRSVAALEKRTDAERRSAPDQRAFQLRVELGLAFRGRGRFADALREFDAAATLMPAASDIHLLRALTLETAGERDAATRAFHTAWGLDQQNAIKAYYVVLHRGDADLDRARRTLVVAYQRSLQSQQKSAPFLTLDVLGDTLSATVSAPVVADATLARGFQLLAAGRYDDAVEALRRPATSVSPDDSPLAHFARARSDEAENRIADARREYEAALPGTLAGRSLLYVGMGRLAQVDGDNASAIDLFVRAVSLTPNDPLVHRELAGALAAADRLDDAFAELVAALLIDPADASTMAAVGQLFLDTGKYEDAITALTRTLQLAPDRFETHYALGTVMTRLGRTADAAREFESFERARRQMVGKRRSDLEGDGRPPDAGGPR